MITSILFSFSFLSVAYARVCAVIRIRLHILMRILIRIFTLIQIGIRFFTLMRFQIRLSFWCRSGSASQNDTDPCGSGSGKQDVRTFFAHLVFFLARLDTTVGICKIPNPYIPFVCCLPNFFVWELKFSLKLICQIGKLANDRNSNYFNFWLSDVLLCRTSNLPIFTGIEPFR